MPSHQRYAKTQEEAAAVLGRTKNTLATWANTAKCPFGREHKIHGLGFDLQKIRDWAVAAGYEIDDSGRIAGDKRAGGRRKPEAAEIDGESVVAKYNRARAEAQDAKAKLAQLEFKERTGELVSRSDVEAEQIAIHRFMREQFEALPRSLGPKLAGKTALEIQARLRDALEDIFRVLSRDPE